ncbi:MAG TPA: hypothetical protein VIQ81_10625 [Gammaproteobacteria bacterium]
MNSAARYYSVRQLSPFVGNIQIIEVDYCRALSSDGQQWQIQASCETHQQIWQIAEQAYVPRRYVLYGSWSRLLGFSSLPLDPMLDVPDLQTIQQGLISALENQPALPFPPQDDYECWLMDQASGQPLALLASVTDPQMIPHLQLGRWQAMPQQTANNPLPADLSTEALSSLERQINLQGQHTQWFRRLADGNGEPLEPAVQGHNTWPLPPLLFDATLLPAAQRDTSEALIRWQSPRLLSLHHIEPSLRQQLEQYSQHFAVETRQRLHTYPVPLSEKVFNKIQVELKIRGL